MKLSIKLPLVAAAFLASWLTADAVERDEIGVGLAFGEPTGVRGQFFWSRNSALNVTAAWSFKDWFIGAVDLQLYNRLSEDAEGWKWSYGIGAYVGIPESRDGKLGVRLPLGLTYHFPESYIDIWAEAAPALRLVDKTEAEFQGAIGVTFWVK